jgi:hypothetical protein
VIQFVTIIAVLLLSANSAFAERPLSVAKAGEEYEISRSYQTSQTSDGSSGSSSGRDTLLERVIESRKDGQEVEYDLPKNATAEDRARSWQFPVRVFAPLSGPMELLNRADLETRVENWLKEAGFTRAACGRWIFTWNAFRIECDPHAVLETLEALNLRSIDLREGALYEDAEARVPGKLTRTAGANGATFTVAMEIDPDAVRRARATSDVAIGEIMQKPVTLDVALSERAKEVVSGTISITLEADANGTVWRRTRVTKVETERPNGQRERETATETVERRLVSGI